MPAAKLTDHLGYWLRKLSNDVSGAFAERLRGYEVSVPQWVVLRTLYDHDSLALREMVSRVEVDQGALSRMVDRLIAKGWVDRGADPHDGRAIAVSLTTSGRKLVPKLANEADRNDEQFFACLSGKQRKELTQMIHQLLSANKSDEKSPTE